MFYRVILIVAFLFIASLLSSSSYDEGYEAFIHEDYNKAINLFNKAIESGEQTSQVIYYISESYLRYSLSLLKEYRYDEASSNLYKAKLFLEEGLKNAEYSEEYNNYLKTLKAVNEAIYAVEHLEASSSRISNFIIIGVALLIVFILSVAFILQTVKKRRRLRKRAFISKELKELVDELNSNFFKTKEILKQSKDDELSLFIEATEDRCIMLNDRLREASYGLRDIDEETFKVEIKHTKDTILGFLSKESIVSSY